MGRIVHAAPSDAVTPGPPGEAPGDGGLSWRLQMNLPFVSLSAASTGPERVRYLIDRRVGPIDLSVDQLGLFSARGSLERFTCDLTLARADPTNLLIDLALDAASIALPEPGRLAFIPWFDVAAHPIIRFRNSAVAMGRPGHYVVRGLLEVGGLTRLLALDAVVAARRADPITDTSVAELVITGRLRGATFGMPSGHGFLADRLDLRILAQIELEG